MATLVLLAYVFVQSVNLNPLYPEGALFYCVAITAYVLIWALFRFGEFTLKELTGGESFETNVQLALNNARCAARIAAALCELKKAE